MRFAAPPAPAEAQTTASSAKAEMVVIGLRSLLPGRWLPSRAECLEPLENIGMTGLQPLWVRFEEIERLGKELPFRISYGVWSERLDSGVLDELIERCGDSALCPDDMTQF